MLGNLGLAALLESRPDEALALFRQALVIDRELGFGEGMIYDLVGIAAALSDAGATADAALLLGAADAAAAATAVELEPLEARVHAELTKTLGAALGSDEKVSLEAAAEHALSPR